jgi:putative addiction module component (TIGR02574 family)
METTMGLSLPLDEMSTEEKLRALELIWDDLRKTEASLPSPAWHRDVLESREARLRAGTEKSIPWDEAKKNIRESTG